jgi:hypothetical protein
MNIGDTVTWRSQAQGSWTEKTGIIIHVVAPRERMDRAKTEAICKAAGYDDVAFRADFGSIPRKFESYLVIIPPSGKRKPALYWPRVSQLALVSARRAQ